MPVFCSVSDRKLVALPARFALAYFSQRLAAPREILRPKRTSSLRILLLYNPKCLFTFTNSLDAPHEQPFPYLLKDGENNQRGEPHHPVLAVQEQENAERHRQEDEKPPAHGIREIQWSTDRAQAACPCKLPWAQNIFVAISTMRFEKPHSLSYHDMSFAVFPIALVESASNTEEAGLWTMS